MGMIAVLRSLPKKEKSGEKKWEKKTNMFVLQDFWIVFLKVAKTVNLKSSHDKKKYIYMW